jgi:hypothetical protein
MFTVTEVHRSLFHPLATVRHRMWAGPGTKETEKNKKHQFVPNKWKLHSRNKHITLPLLLALWLSSVTHLLLNMKFFSQFRHASISSLVEGIRLSLLQLSMFKRTTRLYRKVNVAVCCRNGNKLLNEVKFQFPPFVIKILSRFLWKNLVFIVFEGDSFQRKHVNTDERKTTRRVDRIRHRKMESCRLSHGLAAIYELSNVNPFS